MKENKMKKNPVHKKLAGLLGLFLLSLSFLSADPSSRELTREQLSFYLKDFSFPFEITWSDKNRDKVAQISELSIPSLGDSTLTEKKVFQKIINRSGGTSISRDTLDAQFLTYVHRIKYYESYLSIKRRLGRLDEYIKNGASINALDGSGLTALDWALQKSISDLIVFFLSRGAVINDPENSLTALEKAIIYGNIREVEQLVKSPGVDPEKKGTLIYSPLELAIVCGREDIARFLHQLIGKTDKQLYGSKNDKITALMYAAEFSSPDLVKYLVENGEDPKRTNQDYSAFSYAAQTGDREKLSLLWTGKKGETSVIKSVENALNLALINNQTETVDFILHEGYKIDKSYLIKAVKDKRFEIARLLLSSGKIRYSKQEGEKLFITAAWGQDTRCLQILLEKGVNPNSVTKYKNSALHEAAKNGSVEIARILLEKGAKTDLTNEHGFTALLIAAQYGHLEIIKLLLAHGASLEEKSPGGNSALILAAANGQTDCVDYLLDRGAGIEEKNAVGLTPLLYAAYGCNKITRITADDNKHYINGLNELFPDSAMMEEYGRSSYEILFSNSGSGNFEETVRTLLDHGADTGTLDSYGLNALMHAVLRQNLFGYNRNASGVIELLVSAGSDLDNRDIDGHTALLRAVMEQDLGTVSLLLEKGADSSITNKNGESCLAVNREKKKSLIKKVENSQKYINGLGAISKYTKKYYKNRQIEALLLAAQDEGEK